MRVLGIESSTYTGSVAILDGDTILGEGFLNIGPTHSEKLLPMINWLLSEVGMKKNEIDGIAVSKGPGSFTALRVGIATAKGIAFSLGIPIVGVSSLEVLSRNLFHTSHTICTIIDARKEEIYSAFFKYSDSGLDRIGHDRITNPRDLTDIVREKTIFIGNAAMFYKDFLRGSLGDLALFCDSNFNLPRASNCAQIGIERIKKNYDEEFSAFSPQYLRKADAEIFKER